MIVFEAKLGSCSTRSILCYLVISVAFLGTLLAGFHLEGISVSNKISNIVIPIYGRGGRAVLSSKVRHKSGNTTVSQNELNSASDEESVRDSSQRQRTATPSSVRFIFESECEKRIGNITKELSGSTTVSNSTSAHYHTDRVNVALFAAMRTGSSFVGELLSKRNDFFYLFEPGLRLQSVMKLKNFTQVIHMTKYLELLDGVYRCNYTNLDYFLRYSSMTDYENQRKHIPGLMSPKTCVHYRIDPRNNRTRRFCDPITPAIAEAKCKAKKYVMVKMIRIHDINLLLPLIFDKEIKLKVIHLVRDPRGVVASRLMLYYNTFRTAIFSERYYGGPMRATVEEYCRTWWSNVEIGRYAKEIRKNYLLLRYEDAADDPYGTASRIYEFLGIGKHIPRKVFEWLVNNTLETVPGTSPYSTKRDSKATSEQWRTKLTFDVIKMIENTGMCRKLMDAVGYVPVFDQDDLKKKNISFIGKIPDYDSENIDNYFQYSR